MQVFTNVLQKFISVVYNINIKIVQYNSVNLKLYNSQLNKFKSATKNKTRIMLKVSSNMIGNSNDEANFPHKLILASNTNKFQAFVKLLLANKKK